jgi:hypothetical protein
MKDLTGWGRALFALATVIGCNNGDAATDDGAAAPAAESNVTAAKPTATAVIETPLGLREDLRTAIGNAPNGMLDFNPATVPGALTVTHQYSIEHIALAGLSFRIGQADSGKGNALTLPSIMEYSDPTANAPAKKLFDAMTKAKETTQHNAVLDNDLIERTSPKGLVKCSHLTKAQAPGQLDSEQYWCEIQNAGTLDMQTLAK